MAKSYLCGGLTANELYDLFNRRYFRERLPKIPVRWVLPQDTEKRSRGALGCTLFRVGDGRLTPVEIRLHPKLRNSGTVWATTLIHEMVHVQQWRLPRSQAHGRKFNNRMKQLASLGAFNGLW